jgi:hypothetical protein
MTAVIRSINLAENVSESSLLPEGEAAEYVRKSLKGEESDERRGWSSIRARIEFVKS